MKLTTTFNKLKQASACNSGYRELVKYLGGVRNYGADTEINLLTIFESNGLDDALWCLRATIQDSTHVSRLMAADFAESVLHIFEAKYPNDNRPRLAIEGARKYAQGELSLDELKSLRKDAYDAADAAYAAYAAYAAAAAYASYDAAYAAYAAYAAADAANSKNNKGQLISIFKRHLQD